MVGISKCPGPAARYKHNAHIIRNINSEFRSRLTRGQRIADWLAKAVGSWPFIIYQSIMIVIWMAINTYLVYQGANDPEFFKS